jgi:putative DNA primase/helicase
LKWDGTARIDEWLETYLGAKPDDEEHAEAQRVYLEAIGPKFLISAVARIFRPGCKVDTMLVAESPAQGRFKSSAIKVLFGGGEWFTDHISPIGTKDSKEELAGKWCVEVSELSALQGRDVEKIKAFLSTGTDNYRPSYGHLPRAFPRQCVFFGSTNEDAYLRDATGGRRFWPFKVGEVDLAALERDRDQLWAEAAYRFHQGEQWHLTPEEEALASGEQKDRIEPDAWGDVIATWLVDQENDPKAPIRHTELTVRQVLRDAIQLPKEKWDQRAQNRVAQQLKLLGWERRRKTGSDGRRVWVYERE